MSAISIHSIKMGIPLKGRKEPKPSIERPLGAPVLCWRKPVTREIIYDPTQHACSDQTPWDTKQTLMILTGETCSGGPVPDRFRRVIAIVSSIFDHIQPIRSPNYLVRTDPVYTPNTIQQARIMEKEAFKELNSFRDFYEILKNGWDRHTVKYVKKIKEIGLGTCHDLALLFLYYFRKMDEMQTRSEIVEYSDDLEGDHAFIALNRGKDGSLKNAIFVDPWGRTYQRANPANLPFNYLGVVSLFDQRGRATICPVVWPFGDFSKIKYLAYSQKE